MIMQEIKASIP